MHFGATLRLLRTGAGFTLRDLAAQVGVSSAYLSRVENGHDAPPTPDRLATIARLFGLPPTTLIELADRVEPFATAYLSRQPEARDLMLEIVRRNVGPVGLARIRAFVEREFPRAERSPGSAALDTMLSHSNVVVDLTCSELDDVIDVAASRFDCTDAAALARAILQRERSCSTSLGGGLAVPHAIRPGAPRAVVVTLRRPLPASTPDGEPLRLFVVHTHPGEVEHTRLLAELARIADANVVDAICDTRSADGVLQALRGALSSTAGTDAPVEVS